MFCNVGITEHPPYVPIYIYMYIERERSLITYLVQMGKCWTKIPAPIYIYTQRGWHISESIYNSVDVSGAFF